MEGSSGATGSEGYRCEGFGSPGVQVAPLKWAEMCPCRTDGSLHRTLRPGSSCTDEQAEIPSSQSEQRKRLIYIYTEATC